MSPKRTGTPKCWVAAVAADAVAVAAADTVAVAAADAVAVAVAAADAVAVAVAVVGRMVVDSAAGRMVVGNGRDGRRSWAEKLKTPQGYNGLLRAVPV